MITFRERLRSAIITPPKDPRNKKPMNANQLAVAMGVTRATITNWLNKDDGTQLKSGNIRKAAALLQVDYNYLLHGWDVIPIDAIGVYEVAIDEDYDFAKGVTVEATEIEIAGELEQLSPVFTGTGQRFHFTQEWLTSNNIRAENVKVTRVHGSAMEPVLWDGDMAVIDCGQKKIVSGSVFCIGYGSGTRLARLQTLANGTLRISSDHADKQRFPDESLSVNETKRMALIGRVVYKLGSGGLE